MQINTLTRKLYLVLALAASFACATVNYSAQASETFNKLASNKLASNKLASNKLASNALPSTRFEANMATAELLATEAGRDVYGYLISCALPTGVTIEAAIPDAADTSVDNYTCSSGLCVFYGALGLAEDWIDHRLDPKGQGWVSACVFSRVNFHVEAEAISLRGHHPNLTVSTDEAQLYSVAEGAFYGNIFTGGDGPIDWNACRGEGQASGEFGGLVLRDCAEEDPDNPGKTYCGFNYAGDCRDYTPVFPNPYACKSFDALQGIYDDCHTASGNGQWPGLQKYREVITTYVTAE